MGLASWQRGFEYAAQTKPRHVVIFTSDSVPSRSCRRLFSTTARRFPRQFVVDGDCVAEVGPLTAFGRTDVFNIFHAVLGCCLVSYAPILPARTGVRVSGNESVRCAHGRAGCSLDRTGHRRGCCKWTPSLYPGRHKHKIPYSQISNTRLPILSNSAVHRLFVCCWHPHRHPSLAAAVESLPRQQP